MRNLNTIEKSKTPVQNFLFITFLFFLYVRIYENFLFLIPFQLTRIFMLLAMAGFIMKAGNSAFHKKPLIKENTMKWFLILQLMTIASVVYSVWAANTINKFIATNVRIIITFVLFASLLYNKKQVQLFVKTIYFCMFFFSIRIFLAFKAGSYIFDSGTKRIVGVGTLASSDPNDVALVMGMTIPLGLHYLIVKKGMKRIFYLGLFLSILCALVVTGSRGGLLGLGMGTITFFAMLYRKQKAKFVGIIALLLMVAVVFLPQQYKNRFMSMFNEQEYSHTDQRHGRVAVWKRSFNAFMKRPIGYGGANSVIAEGGVKRAQGVTGKWMVIHNSYLQMGLEIGVLGLIIYLMFLKSGFDNLRYVINKTGANKDRESEVLACALIGGLTAFLVSGMFLSQAYNWNPYIYIVLAMGLKRSIEQQYGK